MGLELKKNMTILFQGDSITDWGRTWKPDIEMGMGYAYMVFARLRAKYPELDLHFLNRGIAGNTSSDLLARWKPDCTDLKPDILSILVGVNNTLRRYKDQPKITSEETFYNEYHELLSRAMEASHPQLVICEPFILPHPEDRIEMREDLDPKIAIVKNLAEEFSAIYVPYDELLAAQSVNSAPSYWAYDGVHPTPAGHAFMANEWIRYTGV